GSPRDDETLAGVVCGREHVCQVTLPLIRRLPPLLQHVGATADADEMPGSEETAESSRVVARPGDFVAVDDVEFGVECSCHVGTVATQRRARVARSPNRELLAKTPVVEGETTTRREAFLPPTGRGSSYAMKRRG